MLEAEVETYGVEEVVIFEAIGAVSHCLIQKLKKGVRDFWNSVRFSGILGLNLEEERCR